MKEGRSYGDYLADMLDAMDKAWLFVQDMKRTFDPSWKTSPTLDPQLLP